MCCGQTQVSEATRQAASHVQLSASSAPPGRRRYAVLRPNGQQLPARDTRAEAVEDLKAIDGRGTIIPVGG